jgi:hypothetical protein
LLALRREGDSGYKLLTLTVTYDNELIAVVVESDCGRSRRRVVLAYRHLSGRP